MVQHGHTSFLIPPRASSRKSSQIDPLASSQSTDYSALPWHWQKYGFCKALAQPLWSQEAPKHRGWEFFFWATRSAGQAQKRFAICLPVAGKSGSANQRLGAEPGIIGLSLPSGLTVSGRASRRVEMLRHSKLQPIFFRAHSSLDAGPLSL